MRFGFAGLGFAARSLHLPAVRALTDGVSIGGFDPSSERRVEWEKLRAGPAYADLDQLLEQGRPDVLVVATPPDSHASTCVRAIEFGIDVICEKPFVVDLAEADTVIAAAARHGRWVAVNQEFRYMPIFAVLPGLVGRSDIGSPILLHCTQFMDLAPWEERVAWRAAMPDRSLFEGGVHLVDLLHLVAGRLPVTVSAVTSSGLDPSRVADAVDLVTLDYGHGMLGQITINRLCRTGTRYVDLRVDCERASLRSSYGGRAAVRIGMERATRPGVHVDFGLEGMAWIERGLRRKVVARNKRSAAALATTALYADTVASVRRSEPPPVSAEDARATLRIIEAAYRSARGGERVALEQSASVSDGVEAVTEP